MSTVQAQSRIYYTALAEKVLLIVGKRQRETVTAILSQ